MKRLGLLLITAIALVFGANAFAQGTGDEAAYFVGYYSNANTAGAPDGVLRLVNDGDQANYGSEGVLNGTLWAAIYVFDDSQELQSCCACLISSDGMLSESVNKQLTVNTFIGKKPTRGVIKVVSSTSDDPTSPMSVPGLRGWFTSVDATSNIPSKGPFYVTRTALADANLGAVELANLGTVCSYGLTIGSGRGLCPCTLEDKDF
jgi:hypothetical protein